MKPSFDALVREAEQQAFQGWDFAYLEGRMVQEPVSWNYRSNVRVALREAKSLLDMGTGGGEFLSSLRPLPKDTSATEAYPPNVPIAMERLRPLGVQVVRVAADNNLPFPDERFDLIINRHEAYDVNEVKRILKPSGRFITQQVGGQNDLELNRAIGIPCGPFTHWDLNYAVEELSAAGWRIQATKEERTTTRFHDIGAVVFYMKVCEWQFPGFNVNDYEATLRRVHQMILHEGAFPTTCHRFYIEATYLHTGHKGCGPQPDRPYRE